MKGRSTINCPKEFELDVLNTFCATRQRIASLALLSLNNLAVFDGQFLLEYYTQRAIKISY